MTVPNFRPMGFGEILDGAFTLYRRNLVTFLVTALLPTLVLGAAFYAFGGAYFRAVLSGDPSALMGAVGSLFLGMILGGLAYMVLWAALTRQAAQAYVGQPTSVGDGMRTGIRKLLPIMGAGFVIGILGLVVYFAIVLVFAVIVGIGAATGSAVVGVVFGLIGGLLALAAYLCAIAMLFAVLPAIIVEDKGPIEAIGRSFDLARGALGRIVGLMVVTILITYLPVMAVLLVTGGFANLADPNALPDAGQFVTQQILGLGAGVLTTPFMVAVIVLLYFDRRVRTEALDVRMAADRLAMAGD
jgi:hypothetical protein